MVGSALLSVITSGCKTRTFSDSLPETARTASEGSLLVCNVADGWQLRLDKTDEFLVFNYSKSVGSNKAEHSFSLKRSNKDKDTNDNDTRVIFGATGPANPAGGSGPVATSSENDKPRSVQLFELISSLPIVGVELNGKLDSSMKVTSASVSVLHQQAATERFSNKYLACQGAPIEFNGKKSSAAAPTPTPDAELLACNVADGWELRLARIDGFLVFNYSKAFGANRAEHSFSLKRTGKDSNDNDTRFVFGANGPANPAGGPGPVVITSENDKPRSVQLFELVSSLPIDGVELNGRLDSSMKVASASVSVLHQQAKTEKFSNKYLTCQGRPTVFAGIQQQ